MKTDDSTELQEQADLLLAAVSDTDSDESGRKYTRLKLEDRTLALRLHARGVAQAEIARILKCAPSTICRLVALIDTRKEARMILDAGAARLADTVVKTDDPAVALKALGKIDVVRDDKDHGGGSHITINVGTPEKPIALPDIVFPVASSDA